MRQKHLKGTHDVSGRNQLVQGTTLKAACDAVDQIQP